MLPDNQAQSLAQSLVSPAPQDGLVSPMPTGYEIGHNEGAANSNTLPDDQIISLSGDLMGKDKWSTFNDVAKHIARQRGFPEQVLLGQAALESAHGTSNFAKNRNNFFGYQAYDSNPDAAKKFSTPAESINAYIDLVESYPGVKEAVKSGNTYAVIQAIKNAGYATDPNYVQKVISTPEFQGGNR